MIKDKILIILSLLFFACVSIFAVWSDLSTLVDQKKNIVSVEQKLQNTKLLSNFIKEIQKERGITNIYFSHPETKYLKMLQKQRLRLKSMGKNLDFIHKAIDTKKYNQKDSFNAYTNIISKMIIISKKLLINTNNSDIKNKLFIYTQESIIQEYLGRLRAKVGGVLARNNMSQQQYRTILNLNTLLNEHFKIMNAYTSIINITLFKDIEKQACTKQTMYALQNIINNKLTHTSMDAIQWFQISTCTINIINQKNNRFLQKIYKKSIDIQNSINTKLTLHIIFWLISAIISFVILFILYRTNKQMLIKHKLLQEYKKAIDNSTIVSKTNKHGIITYANKAFCDISGFTLDELIGKPHNIVRHPDMPKSAFKNLWKTIKSGKTWQGEVKNLKKNGDYYIVNATISPIFDHNNNIIEYIAIRHDITNIHKLNQEIQNTQHELIYRIGESVESRSKETGNHIRRVAKYSEILARLHGLDTQICEDLSIASTMHDVGKIAIPDSILLKPAKLTSEEWNIMKTHTLIGHQILAGSNLPILQMASQIAYEHHERFDGQGYPQALKNKEISLYARIVSIADVFDALISDRVYKKAWKFDRVIELFKEEKGKQFDPYLVELFLNNIDKFMEIKRKYED